MLMYKYFCLAVFLQEAGWVTVLLLASPSWPVRPSLEHWAIFLTFRTEITNLVLLFRTGPNMPRALGTFSEAEKLCP